MTQPQSQSWSYKLQQHVETNEFTVLIYCNGQYEHIIRNKPFQELVAETAAWMGKMRNG